MAKKSKNGTATVNFPGLRTKAVVSDRVVTVDRPGNYHEEGVAMHNGQPWRMWRCSRNGMWMGSGPKVENENTAANLMASIIAHPTGQFKPSDARWLSALTVDNLQTILNAADADARPAK